MTLFTIDGENNITAHTDEAELAPGLERFHTAAELRELADHWPDHRVVEISNTLTGVTSVKKFKDIATGVARIWRALESLVPDPSPHLPDVGPNEAQPGARPRATKQPNTARGRAKTHNVLELVKSPGEATRKNRVGGSRRETRSSRPQARRVGPQQAKPGHHTGRAQEPANARQATKSAQVLELLKRPGGATLEQIMDVTRWQAHSVRGFLSGALGKKMGLTVQSAKREDGQRVYSING